MLFMETVMLRFVRARPFLILSRKPIGSFFSFYLIVFSASSRSTESTVVTPFSCIVTP